LTDRNFAIVEGMRTIAERSGHSMLELAFSWLLRKDVVASVIAGATKPEQVVANAAAADWRFSREELAAIDSCC